MPSNQLTMKFIKPKIHIPLLESAEITNILDPRTKHSEYQTQDVKAIYKMFEERRKESQTEEEIRQQSYLKKNPVDMKHKIVAIKTQWMN